MHFSSKAISVCLLAGTLMPAAAMGDITYGFSRISANAPIDVAGQLFVKVTDLVDSVQFHVWNDGPLDSSITRIYFDDNADVTNGISDLLWGTQAGVRFSVGATPPYLPGGRGISPKFVASFATDSDSPVQPNGLNPGEWLDIVVDLKSGNTFEDLADALTRRDLILGLHVQGIMPDGGDYSDAFVSDKPQTPVNPIPAPGAALLGMLGLTMVGAVKRRFQ